jgi:hypothetical protein
VAHAANPKTDTLPHRIPTITALIPTLTAVIFRRESGRICCDDCLHVICNLCCFHLSIRCFDTLFRAVNRLQLSRDRMRRPLTSSPFEGCSLAHTAGPAPSLIHSALSLAPFTYSLNSLSYSITSSLLSNELRSVSV